jgi:hypothetical protein
VHEPLEDARKAVINAKATIIQKHWKRHSERNKFDKVKNAALRIQHAYRGWKLRINFLRKRRAAIVIQSHLRGVFAREVAAALREMRRVEEEMRKRERLEAERKQREEEQAEADRLALEESERLVQLLIIMRELIEMRHILYTKINSKSFASLLLSSLVHSNLVNFLWYSSSSS